MTRTEYQESVVAQGCVWKGSIRMCAHVTTKVHMRMRKTALRFRNGLDGAPG